MSFSFTAKQLEAQDVITSDATNCLLEGGGRSGKTFLHVRNVVFRALKAPGSRHAILRFRFNHLKQSIILDTLPQVMKLAFPGVEYHVNKTDWFMTVGDGSQIFFGGLDDKERTEKILGMEFVTIYLNECSQIPYASYQIVVTRLAQKVMQNIKNASSVIALKPRMFFDWNPTTKGHWIYKIFHLGIDPDSGKSLENQNDYAYFKINPVDNKENLSSEYLKILDGMGARMRKRFRDGDASDVTANLLFNDVDIEKWRVTDGKIPDFIRIVVGVDPSGSGDVDNADNDAIGIVVGGLGVDGNAYLLDDCTVKAGPATWGKVATMAFERHEANVIVGEVNYGGAMVEHVIQTARFRTPYKQVTATRGKSIRAEPFSALYEQGKVRHVGEYHDLEEELCQFSTSGYIGANSPNRADAWIWVLTELFAGIVKDKALPKKGGSQVRIGGTFMAN